MINVQCARTYKEAVNQTLSFIITGIRKEGR